MGIAPGQEPFPSPPRRGTGSLSSDIYAKARPYLVAIGKDFLVGGSIYTVLFVFEWALVLLPLKGWEGAFFAHAHGIAVLAMFSVFSWLSIIDIYRIHKKERDL